ncbi:MAG: sodium:alanine symporter family protein, partial [Exiguobacterium oxidotolerans]
MDAFQQAVQSGVDFANNILWSYILIAALIGVGIYFTIKTKFIQFRYLKEMFRVT